MFAQCLRLYTARISWTYLDRFNMPSRHFASDPVFITYCRIPINQPARIINKLNCVIPRRFSPCDTQSPPSLQPAKELPKPTSPTQEPEGMGRFQNVDTGDGKTMPKREM
jgi:hypothetical protein